MTIARPRVLLVGGTLERGGTEKQFVEVACGLDRSRWDVDVTCLRAQGPLRQRLDAAGVAVWSCGTGSFKSPARLLAGVARLARHLRRQRTTLVHAFDFYGNTLGVLAARLARVPVIASQRDLGDLRAPFERRVHRGILRLADAVLVNSPAIAERLTATAVVPPQRIAVVPNGIDVARFLAATAGSPTPLVASIANLRPEKGIGSLVEAAALVRERLPEACFDVWGEGPMRSPLEGAIERLGLGGTVRLRGATDRPEQVLAGAHVFVLPSLSEACSNALLEAMAMRLPVVATRVGGNPHLVDDEVSGLLVPPADPPALAKAIIRLLEDRTLAGHLAARASHHVRAHFGFTAMFAGLERLYRRVLVTR